MENDELTLIAEAAEQVTAEAGKEQAEEAAQAEPKEVIPDAQALLSRIEELEAELAQREQLSERMTRECEEFESYFPETSLRAIPDSVWERVHAGVPLAAAYALYERGVHNQKKKDEEREARAACCSLGLPGAADDHYFSPAQVRAMSRGEVRQNYDRIFESMRHWQ